MFARLFPSTIACCLALLLASCADSVDDAPLVDLHVALIPPEESAAARVFERSAQAAGDELGVTLTWRGPFGSGSTGQQALLVQQAASDEVFDGLIVVSNGESNLAAVLDVVRARELPFVTVGHEVTDATPIAHIWNDPQEAGRVAANEIVRHLDGRGTVAMLRQPPGDPMAAAHEAGFVAAIAEHPEITITVDEVTATGAIPASHASKAIFEELLDVDAVFTSAPGAGHGVLNAFRDANLYGRTPIVSIGLSAHLVDALPASGITALVIDDPRRLADHAVRALVSHHRGHAVEQRISVPPLVITHDNQHEAQSLIGR